VSQDLFPSLRDGNKRQRRELETAWAAGTSVVGYYFESKVEDCLRRNRARAKPVPDVALFATIKRLQRPRREEGFDTLRHVRMSDAGFEVTDWIDEDE
jgi:hypothetical protein